MIRKFFAIIAVAAALTGFSTTANAAYTKTSLNLRACASTSCHVKTVMPAGAHVKIRDCRGRWCRVKYRGVRGFASRRHIAKGTYRRQPHYPRPRNGVHLNLSGDGVKLGVGALLLYKLFKD